MDNPNGGLAINQLVKMKCAGTITLDTFEDDMDRSHADYIELSLQLQFNARSRGE